MNNSFAEKLRELRKEEKITIVELSKRIGYSKSIISYWENGVKEPTLSALEKLTNYFGITIGELVGDDDLQNSNKLTREEVKVIDSYRKLSRDGKALVQNTISTILHAMSLNNKL